MKYFILCIAVGLLAIQIVFSIRDIKRMRSSRKKEVSEDENKTA